MCKNCFCHRSRQWKCPERAFCILGFQQVYQAWLAYLGSHIMLLFQFSHFTHLCKLFTCIFSYWRHHKSPLLSHLIILRVHPLHPEVTCALELFSSHDAVSGNLSQATDAHSWNTSVVDCINCSIRIYSWSSHCNHFYVAFESDSERICLQWLPTLRTMRLHMHK